LVTALKNDLRTPGVGGRKFFELICEYNDLQSRELYKPTTPATANSYGSVIKTGYNGNGKPYTHPIYLTNDLPGQILTLLKDIDVRTHSRI